MKLFGLQPKVQAPVAQEPAPVPVVDRDAVAQEASDRLRKRRGRFSTMIAKPSAAPPAVGSATLLGGGI